VIGARPHPYRLDQQPSPFLRIAGARLCCSSVGSSEGPLIAEESALLAVIFLSCLFELHPRRRQLSFHETAVSVAVLVWTMICVSVTWEADHLLLIIPQFVDHRTPLLG